MVVFNIAAAWVDGSEWILDVPKHQIDPEKMGSSTSEEREKGVAWVWMLMLTEELQGDCKPCRSAEMTVQPPEVTTLG